MAKIQGNEMKGIVCGVFSRTGISIPSFSTICSHSANADCQLLLRDDIHGDQQRFKLGAIAVVLLARDFHETDALIELTKRIHLLAKLLSELVVVEVL